MNLLSENIIKYIKFLIYVLVAAIPLVFFPTIMMPFQISKTVIFQILAELIFVLWLCVAIFDIKYRPKFTLLTGALGIFMVIVSLSVVFGSDWRAGLWSDEQRSLGLVALFHFFALFIAITSLKERLKWDKIWSISFWTAILVSLIGISQKFIVFPKEANPWLHIIYSAIPDRVGSTFSNPAFMAGYLLFNVFIGLWILWKSEERKAKSGVVAGLILILIAIFLSQTLGVILGLVVGILILLLGFIFRTKSKSLRKIFIAVLGIIIVFGGVFWLTHSDSFWQKIPGFSKVANFSFKGDAIFGRLVVWQLSLEAFKEKPVLGWGFENFRIAYNENYNPKILTTSLMGSYWDKPHNVVLEYLTTTGILGLTSYLSIFIICFYLICKYGGLDGIIFGSMIVAYFVQNLFIFDTVGTYLMFFLTLAFINGWSDLSPIKYHNQNNSADKQNSNQKFIASGMLLISLMPIYYNYQIFKGANYEYWGINYFLNQLRESSLVSFSKGIEVKTPYIDDIRKNFSNTVKQAYLQDMEYPKLDELQSTLVKTLKTVIERHPKDFLNYLTLAEFYNTFYVYDPSYIEKANKLENKALELSPERQQIYYVIAKTKLLEKDIKGAYDAFGKTVSLSPNSGDPHFFFGLMAYGLGDFKKGSEEIDIAKKLGRIPQKVEELVNLGNFSGDLENNYKKAIEYYKTALVIINGERTGNTLAQRQEVLLKLAVAYYFDYDYEQSRQVFLALKKIVDLKSLPIYPNLEPVLQELKINGE